MGIIMQGKFLQSKDVKKILIQLEKQWGCTKAFEYIFFLSNKNKIYIVNKELAHIDTSKLRVNTFGLYFGEIMKNGDIRLSIEGAQLVGPFASKNLVPLDNATLRHWMHGEDISLKTDIAGYVILLYEKYIVGCGYIRDGTILNYVPKNRRIKTLDIPS